MSSQPVGNGFAQQYNGFGHQSINLENNSLNCPITLAPMTHPVIDEEGHTFEREAIQQVIIRALMSQQQPLCPISRHPISIDNLRNNYAIKGACEEHVNLSALMKEIVISNKQIQENSERTQANYERMETQMHTLHDEMRGMRRDLVDVKVEMEGMHRRIALQGRKVENLLGMTWYQHFMLMWPCNQAHNLRSIANKGIAHDDQLFLDQPYERPVIMDRLDRYTVEPEQTDLDTTNTAEET